MTANNNKIMCNSFLAGALIAFGDIALMQVDNKYIGALLFSFALMSIIQLGIPLYTGRIGTVIHKHNYMECLLILIYNVLGAVCTISMYALMNPNNNIANVMTMVDTKFSHDFVYLFIAGFLCNVLIHIAVTCKNNIVTILCIMCFILCGFEHSIADAGYLLFITNGWQLLKWIIIVAGNTVGGIITEWLLNNNKEETGDWI